MIFNKPLISVCIPAYKTEALLQKCMESVLEQDFVQAEIIVVNDGSIPDKGLPSVSATVKKLKKSSKIPIKLVEHSKNLGLLEARRSAVMESRGIYIFNLDSDDTLNSGALKNLHSVAEKTQADIVQGKACFSGNASEEIIKKRQQQINKDFAGTMTVKDEKNPILDGYLIENKITGYLWGKLIRRSLYMEAFSHIPPVYCTFAEDVIQSLWIFALAKSFAATDSCVYNYSLDGGITSNSIIKNLGRWENICSAASVFTAIISECQNFNPFTPLQMDAIKLLCQNYLANSIRQLKIAVIPQLQDEARKILCDYWGKDFVEHVEGRIQ